MRMHIRRQPPTQRNRLHNPPHTPSRQPAIPTHPQIHHQRPLMHQSPFPSSHQLRLPQRQVSPQSRSSLITQRNQPLLLPLAPHQHRIIPPIHTPHTQPHHLGITNPTPIQQLQNHAIPLRPSHGTLLLLLG